MRKLWRIFQKRPSQENRSAHCLAGREDVWKVYQDLRVRHPQIRFLRTFVETGTFRGETIRKMERWFETLYTIEIDPKLHREAKARYPSPKIHYLLGDSVAKLRIISRQLSDPALFYLDAHFSGTGTGKGAKDVPLIEELEILAQRHQEDCIIVDDLRLFGTHRNEEDWSEVTRDSILRAFGRRDLETIEQGDKLVLLLRPSQAHSH